jgi:hypothetical protein
MIGRWGWVVGQREEIEKPKRFFNAEPYRKAERRNPLVGFSVCAERIRLLRGAPVGPGRMIVLFMIGDLSCYLLVDY